MDVTEVLGVTNFLILMAEGDEHDLQIFSALKDLVSKVKNVKLFITSRPNPLIRKEFPCLAKSNLAMMSTLHVTKDDKHVKHLLESTLTKCGEGEPVNAEHLKYLCDRAGGLFIYATKLKELIESLAV